MNTALCKFILVFVGVNGSGGIVVKKKILDGGIAELKKKINVLLEKTLPYIFYRYIMILYRRMNSKDKVWSYEEECFLKWRPFSKKKYCIIRMEFPVYSIFSAAKRYLFAAEYVRSNGMYPIMDLEWRSDFKKGILKGENIWENVFCQKKSRDVLREDATIYVSGINESFNWCLPETCADINHDATNYDIHATEEKWRGYYRNIYKYVKKYWKFNQYIIRETNRKSTEIFKHKEKILGVALRENFSGEFYALIKNLGQRKVYRNHPLGADVNEILDIVENCVKKWKCEKIFVASVYSDSIKKFEERFPGKIVYFERERMTMAESIARINSRNKFLEDSMGEDQEHRDRSRRMVIEYTQETILLSKCAYLIGAKSGQTIAALSLNGGRYKDIKVLDDKRHIERY